MKEEENEIGSCLSYKAPTLERAWTDYQRLRKLKPATRRHYESCLIRYLGDWLLLKMPKITKAMVIERHLQISQENGPDTAALVMRYLKAIFNFAIHFYDAAISGKPLVTSNPVQHLTALKLTHKQTRRQTIIRKTQLKTWLDGVLSIRNGTSRDLIFFLWLTGCRLNEACHLKWDDVDLDAGIVIFRDTKNHTDHTLPICSFLINVLKRRKIRKPMRSDYVFKGRVPGKPPTNVYKGYKTACMERGLAHKFHDLRRGYGTMANSLGLPDMTVKRLLNHSQAGCVTAGYLIFDPEDLREPVERIAAEFLRLAGYNWRAESVAVGSAVVEVAPPEVTALSVPGAVSINIPPTTTKEVTNERSNARDNAGNGSTGGGNVIEIDTAQRRRRQLQ